MSDDPFNFFKENDEICYNEILKFDPTLNAPIGHEGIGDSDFLTRQIIQKKGYAVRTAAGAKRKSPKKAAVKTKRQNKKKKNTLCDDADEDDFDENSEDEYRPSKTKAKTHKSEKQVKSKAGRRVLREKSPLNAGVLSLEDLTSQLNASTLSLNDLPSPLNASLDDAPLPASEVVGTSYDYNEISLVGDDSAEDDCNISMRTRSRINKAKAPAPPKPTRGRGRKKAAASTRSPASVNLEPHSDVILIGSPPTPRAGVEYERQRSARNRSTRRRQTSTEEVICIGSPPTPRAGIEYEMAVKAAQGRAKPGRGKNKTSTSNIASPVGRPDSAADSELDDFDDDNPLISVKIRWKHKIEAFKLRKYEKFSNVLKIIAEREAKNLDNFIYILNDNLISPDQSPASTDYKISDLIEMKPYAGALTVQPQAVENKTKAPNEITVKIQMDIKKHKPISVTLNKTERLKILYIKCAEEIAENMNDFNLIFDGERLQYDDTPNDHDMANGDMIDFRMKKK